MDYSPLPSLPSDRCDAADSFPRPSGFGVAAAALLEEVSARRSELELQNRALSEANAGLQQALQRYADLYDHLPIACVTLSAGGRILQPNRTAAIWLRRQPHAVPGCLMSWFLDAFDAGRLAAHLEACLATGQEQRVEVTLRPESGLQTTVELCTRPAIHDGMGERLLHCAMTAVTKLRQTRALVADMTREDEQFTRSIAAAIGAPLDLMSHFARTVLTEYSATIPLPARDLVERMECAALRLEAGLRHLLAYCHLQHEDLALDPLNLDELVQQVIVEQRPLIARHRAEIVIERPLPCARGARLLLGQILSHLVASMLRHATAAEPAQLRIAARVEGAEVHLELGDTALRVDAAAPAGFRLFERMQEYDHSIGHGVTLALIRGAVERMHGRINVAAEAGEGHRVCLTLPAV